MTDWNDVGQALVGSWPSQVASWGRSAIVAYCNELEARELSPDAALVAIRACGADQKFPPSAPELAALAHRDPSRPTFEELMAQLYEPGGVFGFKRSGVMVSPWVLAFVRDAGRDWLRELPVLDPDEGKWARRNIKEAWDRFLEANEGRRVAEIAVRSGRGSLGRVDPWAEIRRGAEQAKRAELEPGR